MKDELGTRNSERGILGGAGFLGPVSGIGVPIPGHRLVFGLCPGVSPWLV